MAADDFQDEGVQRPFDVTVLDKQGDALWTGEVDAMDEAHAERIARGRFDAAESVRVEGR